MKINIIIIFIKYLFYKLNKYKFNIKKVKFLEFLINIKDI